MMLRSFSLSLLLLMISVLSVCVNGLITSTYRGALNARHPPQHVDGVEAQWITQRLDHSDLSNPTTWQQKYYLNNTFWGGNGYPVFFMLGGEGPLSPAAVSGHFIISDYAQKWNALVVSLEHRFYGDSIPLNSSATSNLKYLNSQQALADAAFFQSTLTQILNSTDSDWVVFGGSYSGSLSAWLRAKYPLQFKASISASAPVLAQTDFPEYFSVVSNSVGASCEAALVSANNVVAQMLQTSDGLAQLSKDFNTCSLLSNSPNDITQFVGALSNGPAGVVQYNDDNNLYQPFNIPTMCSMIESAPSPYEGFVYMTNLYNNQTNAGCIETRYENFIASMQPTSAGRSWTWQTCIEFGYFQTGEAANQPFSPFISLASFLQQCVDIFGIPNLKPDTQWTNTFYGAKDIVTSNTFFTNGNVDPWHILGITSNPPLNTNMYFIDGTAHCADLYPPRAQDLPGLVAARQLQQEFIQFMVGNSDQDSTVIKQM